MSSLAAARADNFYYPPGWDPSKGSINKFQKSHPLGARASQIDKGILVVRFEMPFNVWCTNCETHIGKGVRYNAKKKKVAMYFTTIIYEFELKCTECSGKMLVRNDPENRTYAMVQGIRQKNETFTAAQNETIEIGEKVGDDPFARLEHDQKDKKGAKVAKTRLESLLERQEVVHSDPYTTNSKLRQSFRVEKKRRIERDVHVRSAGVTIPLLDATREDQLLAASISFRNKSSSTRRRFSETAKRQRLQVKSECIFDHPSAKTNLSSSLSTKTQKKNRKQKQTKTLDVMAKAKKLGIRYTDFARPS